MREGWRRARLDDAAEVAIGRQRSPKHADGPHLIPYMRAANVKDGRLALSDVLTMNFNPNEQAAFGLRCGDVLVTEGCGSIGELGASARWSNDLSDPVCFQNTLLRLRARADMALPEFVEQWSRWAHKSGIWAGVSGGTNIFHIGLIRAKEIPILLPPLAEQRRIVDLVAAVDEATEAAERLQHRLSDVADAIFETVIEEASYQRRLGELASVTGGKRLPKGTPWSDEPTKHPYIRVVDMKNGVIDDKNLVFVPDFVWPVISRYVVRTCDVIISIAGTIGEVAVIPPSLNGASLTENAARIAPEPGLLDAAYLARFLRSNLGKRQVEQLTVGTTQKKLALFRIEHIDVPMLSVQRQKVAMTAVNETETAATAAAEVLLRLRAARSALLSDLLCGDHEIPDSYDELLSA
jgi:type I restriction enzyme, S subunit